MNELDRTFAPNVLILTLTITEYGTFSDIHWLSVGY